MPDQNLALFWHLPNLVGHYPMIKCMVSENSIISIPIRATSVFYVSSRVLGIDKNVKSSASLFADVINKLCTFCLTSTRVV